MRAKIRPFIGIAGLTALEAIRQPIFLLLATVCIVLIGLFPLLITHTLGEARNMTMDSALALYFVCGLVLGSLAASSTLNREIRRGTAATVLCKPVGHTLFFFAKYAGMATVMLLFSAAACMATIVADRVAADEYSTDWRAILPLLAAPVLAYAIAGLRNYVSRKPFASSAFVWLLTLVACAFLYAGWIDPQGHPTPFGAHYAFSLFPAVALIALAVLLITGLAVSLATRLTMVPNLACCSLLFLAGLMSDYLIGRHAAGSHTARALYALIPNLQHFWVVDALHGGGTIPWPYVAQASVYTLFYLAGVLTIGIWMFRNMEVKA